MKKALIGIVAMAMITAVAFGIEPYTTRDVRDPVKLKARLDADFATVATGVGVAAVTNATAATTITKQNAAITATAVFTPQTYVIPAILADGTTNTVASVTNGTIAVTIVNGTVVMTNATAATVMTLEKN
jgi:hypothetical protein